MSASIIHQTNKKLFLGLKHVSKPAKRNNPSLTKVSLSQVLIGEKSASKLNTPNKEETHIQDQSSEILQVNICKLNHQIEMDKSTISRESLNRKKPSSSSLSIKSSLLLEHVSINFYILSSIKSIEND